MLTPFPVFQEIYPGCCTVAAHGTRSTGLESAYLQTLRCLPNWVKATIATSRIVPAKQRCCSLVQHGATPGPVAGLASRECHEFVGRLLDLVWDPP